MVDRENQRHELKKKKQREEQKAQIEAQPNTPVPSEESGVEDCPLKNQPEEIKVTPKIDMEYKVVLLDRGLSQHQESGEKKFLTDPTAVECSGGSGFFPRLAGVTCTRCLLFGAKTPWKRVRLTRILS